MLVLADSWDVSVRLDILLYEIFVLRRRKFELRSRFFCVLAIDLVVAGGDVAIFFDALQARTAPIDLGSGVHQSGGRARLSQ